MEKLVKILTVNTGCEPIKTERFDISAVDSALVKKTILTQLNAMGKSSHVLIRFGDKYWTANHKAIRGPSKEYSKMEIDYHPMMKELV